MSCFRAAFYFLAIFLPHPVFAQDNGECLGCHGDASFSTEREGKTVLLAVDETKFNVSVHGKLSCVNCHAGLKGKDLPHAGRPEPVLCAGCHRNVQEKFMESLHGKALAKKDPLAPTCQNCHGSHDIAPVRSLQSAVSPLRIPYVCGSCHSEGSPVQSQRQIHQSNIFENYSESIHGEGLLKKGLSVSANCVSCHSAHEILPHTDKHSTINRDNIVKTCTRCHGQIEDVHRKIINGRLWEERPHAVPVCIECHQPHKIRKVFYNQGMADRDCLHCHANDALISKDGRRLGVRPDHLADSAHKKVACAQCHSGATPSSRRSCETVVKKVDCSVCHENQTAEHRAGIHGRLLAKNDSSAPSCGECHGTHQIWPKKDKRSPTFPTNIPGLCARCHREGEKAALRNKGTEHEIVSHYVESIHGKGLLKSGLLVAATCASCHTAHRELPAGDPASSVNKNNVAATCAQCHHGVFELYITSVHSVKVLKTDKELPTCNNCHTAHTIKRTDQEGFRVGIMNQCGRCHAEIAKTYFETYHGKVSQLGYGKTAKCHDCHGAHDIAGVNDPKSHLSRQNVVATCQKCHPGATRRFAGYMTHATHHDPKKYPLIFWTFWAMTGLLVGTFGVAGIHTLLWIPRAIQIRREHPRRPPMPGEKQFVRFRLLERLLHATMVVSFLGLAITGMMLKFSYSNWAVKLSHFLGGFEIAGNIHRFCALLMIAVFITHLVALIERQRQSGLGWKELISGPDTLLPTIRDAREIATTLKWYLGLGPRPRYGRWTYWEKFDYFAVFWGITIIGSSGLMLWFPEFFTRLLPGWFINIATIIHSDEALLAVGFIFTVHFFNTHFRPDKFPMDIVIFTGQMPLEELKRERPQEYETLLARAELEGRLAEPLNPLAIAVIRVFAWAALAVGLLLVIAIIYAMVFTYR
ncbi:MAG: cytochrome b/b6 domain-containing protein [Elusimicrobiota bacterium]